MSEDLYGPIPPDPAGDTAGSGEAYTRRAGITWAHTIKPLPVTWAWRDDSCGRIPAGALAMAAGREGTGKSSFGIWLAAHITRGTLPGSFFGTPRKVFYVAVEDSWEHTLVPRMMAAGADLSMVGRFDVLNIVNEEMPLSLPLDNVLFERAIDQHDVALVVIDPLLSTIGDGIDSHKNREVRKALDPIVKIAGRTGAVILGIAHHGKSQSSDASSLIVGSGAFKDVPRSIFSFARDTSDDGGGMVMSQSKNSLGAIGPSLSYRLDSIDVPTPHGPANVGRFEITGVSERSVDDLIRDSRGGGDDEPGDRDDAATWLKEYLASKGGEADAKDVKAAAKAADVHERTLQRAYKRAGVTITRSGFPARSVWSLDPVAPQSRQPRQLPEAVATGATAVATGQADQSVGSGNPVDNPGDKLRPPAPRSHLRSVESPDREAFRAKGKALFAEHVVRPSGEDAS